MDMINTLPGKNCGLCGFRTCGDLSEKSASDPDLINRCIFLHKENSHSSAFTAKTGMQPQSLNIQSKSCACTPSFEKRETHSGTHGKELIDTLGRRFDFYLEHFPEDPGPRETIIPHNPMITREMDIQVGDVMLGRPLGMSCGCPVTHCGIAVEVDKRTGVIVWCVTGPLKTREKGYKDIGYYIAEAYDGLVKEPHCEIKIGMRYYFQPRMCMLQWRHSGLVNYINKVPGALQIRLEGLFIG